MFRPIYEAAAAIFLLQGVLIPILLVAAGGAWFRQLSRLAAVEEALAGDRKRQRKFVATLLESVPKLQPLTCTSCGSPMALEEETARCISCGSVAALPDDYRATLALRRTLPRLAAAAIRHWRVARFLTAAPVRWLLRLSIFAEPLLFMLVLIGSASYDDTFLDRAFERIGEGWSFALMLMAFGGFILWMIVFLFLSSLSKELRRKLAAFPDFRGTEMAQAEFATCRSCGGGISFGPGRLACLCGYCAVANFRAEQARRERTRSEQEQVQAEGSLFGAMEIIEDFTGTFFITMTILSVGFALLVLITAITGE